MTDRDTASVREYAIESDCSEAEFLAVARVYARDVAASHDLSVSVSSLDWRVSRRAKRRAGAVTHREGEPTAVVLTWEHFAELGWPATAAVIRHELIHVHLLNELGDPSHGPAFRRLADQLDTHLHCERFAEPSWWVTCADCGARLARYRRSTLVESPERFSCGSCGGRLQVEQNG